MITKTGNYMVKQAFFTDPVIGGTIGAVSCILSAHGIDNKDQKLLKKYYGLPEDASLELRNAGRGFIGGFIGGIPGHITRSINPGAILLNDAIGITGALGISNLLTDKYSKKEANRIRNILENLESK